MRIRRSYLSARILTTPTLSALVSLDAEADSQASALGAAASLNGLAQALAPNLATFIFSFGVSFGVSGFVMIAAATVNAIALPVLVMFAKGGFPDSTRVTPNASHGTVTTEEVRRYVSV